MSTKMKALRKFSTEPEGKVKKGGTFKTDRPDFFITHGIAERARGKTATSGNDSAEG